MKAQFINENIKFERGISSKEALGVGSLAIRVIRELKMLDKYMYFNMRISEDGDEIFLTADKIDFTKELKDGTEIRPINVRQHIQLDDPAEIKYSITINEPGYDDFPEETWELDKPSNAFDIAQEAELNYDNAEYNFEESLEDGNAKYAVN